MVEFLPDYRRAAAHLSQGMGRLLIFIQACLEDVHGAVEADQKELAAHQTRIILLECLAIRGVSSGGEVTWAADELGFDHYSCVDRAVLAEAAEIAESGLGNRDEAWFTRLDRFIAETEHELGLGETLPMLRSPEGMYTALRMARPIFNLVDELNLPPILPAGWKR